MMAVGQIAMHNLPSCAALVRGTDEEEEKGREREGRIGIKEPHLCHVHRRRDKEGRRAGCIPFPHCTALRIRRGLFSPSPLVAYTKAYCRRQPAQNAHSAPLSTCRTQTQKPALFYQSLTAVHLITQGTADSPDMSQINRKCHLPNPWRKVQLCFFLLNPKSLAVGNCGETMSN